MSIKRPYELLVIDDNPADADLVRHTIRRMELAVSLTHASDAEQATALGLARVAAREPLPDLAFVDINLPGMSGLDMLREWKREPQLTRIPVVVLSSSRSPLEVLRTYDLSCAAFVQKPGNLAGYRALLGSVAAFWFGVATLPSRVA